MALQLTQAELARIIGQYDVEGVRNIPPELQQWLSTLPTTEGMTTWDGNQSVTAPAYQFDNVYGNEYGAAPIGPDGQPLWIPSEQRSVGETLGRMGGVLGGAALLGNAPAMLASLGGGGGGGVAAGGGAFLGEGVASGIPAWDAAASSAGLLGGGGAAAGSGAFLGEGMASGVPAWDAAATGAGLSLASPAAGAAAAGSSWADYLRQGAGALGGGSGLGALGAAGLGALAGVAGNGDLTNTNSTTSNGTNTQSLAPWLQGYAQDYVSRAQSLANGPMSNASLDTAGGLLNRYATQGDPLVNSAMAQQQNVIGGGLLNSNPYIDQVARGIGDRMGEAYATGTRAGTFSGFNNDGNSVLSKSGFGQTLGNNDRAFADSLGQTMSGLYYGNYRDERGAQDNAARASTGLANFGVNNATNLAGFGADQWQRPFAANQQFGSAINPAFGSSSTSNQTGTQTQNITAPNDWMASLGGAAAGAGIYRSIFGR